MSHMLLIHLWKDFPGVGGDVCSKSKCCLIHLVHFYIKLGPSDQQMKQVFVFFLEAASLPFVDVKFDSVSAPSLSSPGFSYFTLFHYDTYLHNILPAIV